MEKNYCKNAPLLSICIPTNGMMEWVCPVIESIYSQEVSLEFFEVLVACNADNISFDNYMRKKTKQYNNLYYKKTNEQGFVNQISCFKMAKGHFVKFLNHRMLMLDGSMKYLIDFIMENRFEKPAIYFTNGNIKCGKIITTKFDKYIYSLGIYSSWSGGVAFWNNKNIQQSFERYYNKLFPHVAILYDMNDSSKFIVDDVKLMKEITTETKKKSRYDFFFAFAVEYLSILLDLYRKNLISINTFLYVKYRLKYWLADQCINFFILKKETAYDLSGFPKSLLVFYNYREMLFATIIQFIKRSKSKIQKCLRMV